MIPAPYPINSRMAYCPQIYAADTFYRAARRRRSDSTRWVIAILSSIGLAHVPSLSPELNSCEPRCRKYSTARRCIYDPVSLSII